MSVASTGRRVLRDLAPRRVRELAYSWHPGRAKRWAAWPGLVRVEAPGVAVLTFDDGPDPDATPEVLAALSGAGATATFFVTGEQVDAHPDLARAIVDGGHEIALHGQSHIRHDLAPGPSSEDDVRRSAQAVERATGVTAAWFRPPYGKSSDAAAAVCGELGMKTVYWSGWGLDWEDVPASRIAQVAGGALTPGAILLLHDSARYGRRPSAQPTAEAIPLLAQRARASGLRLVSVGEAVAGS